MVVAEILGIMKVSERTEMEVYINVKNFGKISSARVNISNFTVFVGNNNSGKTQLMELIYAVIKHVSALTPDMDLPQINDVDAFRMGKEEITDLNERVNKYLAEHIHEMIDETFNASVPIEEITVEFRDIDAEYEMYFQTDRTIEYLLSKNMIEQESLKEMVLNNKYFYRVHVLKNGKLMSEKNNFIKNFPVNVAKGIEIGNILGDIMGGDSPVSSNVLFLPASRMGLMLLYKHYFGSAGQSADEMIRSKNQNSKGIPKPILDFLSFLLKYSYTERVAKGNEELIDFIFNHLIDGTISEKGDATVYMPNDQKKEIPVFVASSMVNEVVPVVKALTDSDKVNFIFYDEVETSMHPLKQMEMVKLLNRLNNRGIRLLVSTHSDTMATKLNNLLLLSRGGYDFDAIEKGLEKNGIQIEKEDLLVSENIHVYQFVNEKQGKSVVEELEFRKAPCTGYDFSLFNDSTMNLFEEAKVAMGIEDEEQNGKYVCNLEVAC